MSEVPQLEHFNQKKRAPRNDQFLSILYEKNNFSGSPKGTPHDWCRRTMKQKLFRNENPWNSVVTFKKLMNMFTGDLYSMYVVLQGIGSLPCIRVNIILRHYVILFGK